MTKRNSVATSWATNVASQVTDAELDTTHPSGHGGTGKTAKGWVSETEPHQWENFNIKLREDRQWAILRNGRIPWDEEVKYKLGAVTYLSGISYVSLQAANLNHTPATSTTYWSPVKFTTFDIHTTTIADMGSKYAVHTVPGQIAHGETIGGLLGSTQATIDNQIKVVSDDLAAHIPLTNNPHSDTATGIGTIANTGGSFTGQVNYRNNLSVGTDSELMCNTTTLVNFRSNTGAIGIGIADYHIGGRWQQILSASNYQAVNALFNPSFVVPRSDLHFPLMNDLNSTASAISVITHTRSSTLAYTDRNNVAQTAAVNAAAFEVSGLKLAAGMTLTFDVPGLVGARDGCISYTLNNVVVVKDVQFTSRNLMTYFGVTIGNVKNFRVWAKRLTPRQKLRIPK